MSFINRYNHSIFTRFLTYALTISFFNTVVCTQNVKFHFRVKRLPPDQDDMIESKYDVNVNTIILTKESRSMGAKYINETEVASNEECLLRCWENSNCNVAVFEEMTRRSCFLFDCGAPADFRCKFMTHKFYTSSIMKATQHSYDLKQWGKEMKQEKDLAVAKPLTTYTTTAAPMLVPTATDAVLKSPMSTVSTSTEPSFRVKTTPKCRHYQFPCFNSSECIAIYNVCDGIPQCPDGSDESADLQCPNKGSNINPNPSPPAVKILPTQPTQESIAANPPAQDEKAKALPIPVQPLNIPKPGLPLNQIDQQFPQPENIENDKLSPAKEIGDMVAWPDGYKSHQEGVDYDRSMEGPSIMHSPFTHKHSTFLAANSPQYAGKWQSEYDRYPQPPSGLDQQYNLYEQRLEEPYPKGQYPDYERTVYDTYHPDDNALWIDQDRLRNGNYLNTEFTQPNLPAPNRQAPYPVREDMYVSHQLPAKIDARGQYVPLDKALIKQAHNIHESNHRNLMPDQGSLTLHHPSKTRPQLYSPYEDMPRTDYRPYPGMRMQGLEGSDQQAEAQATAQVYSRDEAIRESLSKQLKTIPDKPLHMYEPFAELPTYTTSIPHTSQAKEIITNSNKEKTPETTTEHLNNTVTKASKLSHQIYQENLIKISAAEPYQAQSIRIHESNNAIVALTLGLIVTALLLVLVGCRLRTIRRRSTRRGRPLAHDADYLVNGLYL